MERFKKHWHGEKNDNKGRRENAGKGIVSGGDERG